MKLLPALFAAAVLATPALVWAAPADTVPARISVSSELADLAEGYERAFRELTASRAVLHWRFDGRLQRTTDIISVKALAGVVVIEIQGRDRLVLDPRSIVLLTDSPTSF